MLKVISHVFLPLAVGSLIYLFRCNDVIAVKIIDQIFLYMKSGYLVDCQKPISDAWILYSLPDGLWLYALTSAMLIIWGHYDRKSIIWIISGLLIALISEVLQYTNSIPGTFDPVDVIFYMLAFVLSNLFLSAKLYKSQGACNEAE
jgi:hypothetical protein